MHCQCLVLKRLFLYMLLCCSWEPSFLLIEICPVGWLEGFSPWQSICLNFIQSVQFPIAALHNNVKDWYPFRKQHFTSLVNCLFFLEQNEMFIQQFSPSKVFPSGIMVLGLSVSLAYMIEYRDLLSKSFCLPIQLTSGLHHAYTGFMWKLESSLYY